VYDRRCVCADGGELLCSIQAERKLPKFEEWSGRNVDEAQGADEAGGAREAISFV